MSATQSPLAVNLQTDAEKQFFEDEHNSKVDSSCFLSKRAWWEVLLVGGICGGLLAGVPLGVLLSARTSSSSNRCDDSTANIISKNWGSIEVYSESFHGVVDPSSTLQLLATMDGYPEGPLWDSKTETLLVSNALLPSNSIFSWSNRTVPSSSTAGSGLVPFMHPAGYIGYQNFSNVGVNALPGYEGVPFYGPNGQIFNKDLQHVLCQQGNGRIVRVNDVTGFEPICSTYLGTRFYAPNDVIQDQYGWYWFTDLNAAFPDMWGLNVTGVFATKGGQVVLVESTLTNPNGLAFFPGDETRLLLSETGDLFDFEAIGHPANYYSYDVTRDAVTGEPTLSNKNLFFDGAAHSIQKQVQGHADGLKIHSSGIVFASGPGGILVLDSTGTLIAQLGLKGIATNCWIAEDSSPPYLFITASDMADYGGGANIGGILRLELKF